MSDTAAYFPLWRPLTFQPVTLSLASSLLSWGELPTAGTGDTSCSLAGSSLATPADRSAESQSARATHRSLTLSPAQAQGIKHGIRYSCRHSCCMEGTVIKTHSRHT